MKAIAMWLEKQKVPIIPVADDAFPLSQYCMIPCSKKNLADQNILFNSWKFVWNMY